MKGNIKILFIGLLVGLLSSCVTSRKVNYMQEPDKYIPHYADTLGFEDYELRIGDRLYVYVYSLDENVMRMYNSGGSSSSTMRQQMGTGSMGGSYDLYTYLIDEEGNIDFPTIGKIHVHGLTTRDVKHKLEEELGTLLKEIPGFHDRLFITDPDTGFQYRFCRGEYRKPFFLRHRCAERPIYDQQREDDDL